MIKVWSVGSLHMANCIVFSICTHSILYIEGILIGCSCQLIVCSCSLQPSAEVGAPMEDALFLMSACMLMYAHTLRLCFSNS